MHADFGAKYEALKRKWIALLSKGILSPIKKLTLFMAIVKIYLKLILYAEKVVCKAHCTIRTLASIVYIVILRDFVCVVYGLQFVLFANELV